MTTSRFVSISSYCLVEYMAEPLGSSNYLNDDIILIKNATTGNHQILNTDASISTTQNIQDLTAVNIGNNKVAYADSEKIPDYLAYDSNLITSSITGFNVVYDTVRFHFISGFQLEGFEALLLNIKNTQNNGDIHTFANILVAPETIDQLITFNSKPMFLSDSLYDRYIDIRVPSVKNINDEFRSSANPAITFSAAITPTDIGHSGFIHNSPIIASVSECGKREKLDTNTATQYDVFEVTEHYETTISQTNEFDNLGASIAESANGDFIEYFLTYSGAFPEDFIASLNKRNPQDDWIIIHQLSIFEQVGSTFINSSRQVIFQEDNYDEPLVFRPVLKNAGSAISMSIDLLSRLTNKRNGEQVIREASFNLISPKKYGKSLINIPLSGEPRSHKIYNKIIKKNFESTKLFIEPSFAPGFYSETATNPVATKSFEYIPVFFSNNNISVSNNSGLQKTSDISDSVIFGPGKLRFIMTPFDNTVKIKMFNIVNTIPSPIDLNMSSAKYSLVFETSSGNISIDNANNAKQENLTGGELVFNVSKQNAKAIVSSNRYVVYITSTAQNGNETVMYNGEWRPASQQVDIDDAVKEARKEAEELQSSSNVAAELEDKIDKQADSAPERFDDSNNSSVNKQAQPSTVNRFGTKNPKQIKTNVSNAGSKSTS